MSWISRWSKLLLSTFAVVFFLSGLAAGQCAANANGFTDAVIESGDQRPTDTVLNAYAAIFLDADPRAGSFCNGVAATHLRNKLVNTQNAGSHVDMLNRTVGPFAGWLEGAYVTYIFPAAIRLNQDGLLSSDQTLQNSLLWVASTYNSVATRVNGTGPVMGLGSLDGCGLDATHGFSNTCMDDYSVAAAGFAWAAAYERMVNNPLFGQLAEAAHFMIDKSFDTTQSICIVPNSVATNHNPQDMTNTNGRGPCTGTATTSASPNLQDGTAQTFSLNHIGETPAYGFGLLTSISSAALGLKLAAADYHFSAAEQYISKALAAEATRLTEPTGNASPFDYHFKNRPTLNDPEACPVIVPVGATTFLSAPQFQITYPVNIIIGPDGLPHAAGGDCADAGYFPRMYPLSDFYTTLIGSPGTLLPLPFGPGLFNQDPNGHFGAGRQVYYGSLGLDAQAGLFLPVPPLPPNPVYPGDGAQNVSSSFPVRWNDGLDTVRRVWPVTYAIWYKYWPFGGFEPASYTLVVAAQPCNSVTFGTCETFVTGEPDGNFRWYVIANMDVSRSTGIPNSILSTQSSIATFTVGQPSQTGISVVAGTYGGNCGAPHGNVTGALGSACNTLGHCDYIVDYTILGDPAPGCAKDYVAEWTCNGQSPVQQATASPEAGFRKTVTLACPSVISVVAGTYGGNCGAPHGNVTGSLASACNTLGRCDYIVDYTIIGDPAPGCAKDYVAEWTCNGQSLVQQATASPEAGFRKTVTLTCP